MDLTAIEQAVRRLDAAYRPVATRPVDLAELGSRQDAGTELAALGVAGESEALLRTMIEAYAAGDEDTRTAIRGLFDRYPSFRWAAHLPSEWHTAAEFRDHLVHLAARDQGADARDEILTLQALCERARGAGIDVAPILAEVAAMASATDRYQMGSMRDILLRYGG